MVRHATLLLFVWVLPLVKPKSITTEPEFVRHSEASTGLYAHLHSTKQSLPTSRQLETYHDTRTHLRHRYLTKCQPTPSVSPASPSRHSTEQAEKIDKCERAQNVQRPVQSQPSLIVRQKVNRTDQIAQTGHRPTIEHDPVEMPRRR
ncbi:hypothetical protein TOT_030000103 [Theileria orientalis strain Shintoku]|uniref:Secreted protein n=1 Tax=Theileria orientalis strain Shintoku TaxID=869250 RepID=J4C3Q3_THEOR|nr:hypothetical protein TOT_030000103 [Theileria orientalis strain Shintoku]BAM40841.1 hypothetical protein TOT_030000103 [Theileria orientalis strain Shintoku]|eukprot:XP_009691142.1 hypothetical protein TOT_030000103 [Theileria orientalis strain Shintoku]